MNATTSDETHLSKRLTRPSYVNAPDEAKALFKELEALYHDIQYKEIKRGENAGDIKVLPIRSCDREDIREIKERIEQNGLGWIMDHENAFRTIEDDVVVTFSPYNSVAWSDGQDGQGGQDG